MAINIIELAAAMRKAVKRKADESDSDESVDMVTNRGNKLKKKARYVHEGQLAPPSGPEVYKKTITHAGYERDVISRRPVVYDEDGYEIESDDDDEEHRELIAAANEFYPYADVRIEELLAPLTRPADLPDHPTLSRPFKSKPLTELTTNAREMVQKERASLWKMKNLLTQLSGDQSWIPCETMETADDINLFGDGRRGYREHYHEKQRLTVEAYEETLAVKAIAAAESALDESLDAVVPVEAIDTTAEATTGEDDVAMIEASAGETLTAETATTATDKLVETDNKPTKSEDVSIEHNSVVAVEFLHQSAATDSKDPDQSSIDNPEKTPDGLELTIPDADEGAGDDQDDIPAPHRMRTRAQAQAASDATTTSRNRSSTPESNESYIHPFFLAPASAQPDRDIGLPSQEAEDTRRLLQLYVQKQEEVCRGAQKLYEGLLRADRMRAKVLKWAKADAHIGEMSDGEDWYDKEEWGLTEDLKKGQDEEEEDAATTAKKTRTRRQ